MMPYMRRREFLYWLVGLMAGCTTASVTPTLITQPTLRAPTVTLALSATSASPHASAHPPTLTPTITLRAEGTSAIMPSPTATEAPKPITFTIVYDNNPYISGMKTAWGFACLVELEETTMLFDTGGDSSTLLSNMAALDKDPQAIDIVVLSHFHGDHTGGLGGLLDTGVRPVVYAPTVFPTSFKKDVQTKTELIEVERPQKIRPGVFTTGQVSGTVVEQALAVETAEGWVVVTGCAHPGIVEMTRAAQQATGGDIAWVIGGFHLGNATRAHINAIIKVLHGDLGVGQVVPTHCTGEQARAMFAEAWGEACHLLGVGAEITLLRQR